MHKTKQWEDGSGKHTKYLIVNCRWEDSRYIDLRIRKDFDYLDILIKIYKFRFYFSKGIDHEWRGL